ncbi:PucR family transcriptional regulator ligand-binding domain-containing protein [Pseudomonas juntendi]|uniref:PucR family transcriptional regulator n=2 Tax=Pseudomonas TaxID=286 RepID=UPI0001FB9634|nr:MULTISPECIES: PucR family transcriptional regulator [Pseudomonas]MCQ1992070.1 PucR family transcriptional regulator ligand-binding domain-containing protein [Pseudomonas sp. Eb3]EGB95140.1 Fis family transcriptional regulator [Pseudomonas sp. TJI-51]MBA6123336.1 PucR family transcriptional regulator ligand-binding domain-containing protein [Pseudomonas juntendi]MBH3373250.1 PucR family transcriptional regulator ligand-binding domain-containing protein [Pseudomonas juntendi]MBI6913476.1 PucR
MSLALEEILQLPGLHEMSVRAGARNLQRRVRWPYVAENEGIAEWVMGGELVFVTGINHPRGEANLLALVEDGDAVGIAGLVILTGGSFIQHIAPAVIARAEQLGLPLIEQPYALKMVVVTHLIGTALVQMTQVRRSRNDILGQLLSGDYPSLAIARQRAAHLQLALDEPRRLLALRLAGVDELFQRLGLTLGERRWQHTRQALEDQLQAWCRQQPGSVTAHLPGDLFVVLLADTQDLPERLAGLYRQLQGVAGELSLYMGLSSLAEDCAHYRQALNEARQALDVARHLRPASGYCNFSELGVLRLLQGIVDRSLIDDFVSRTLGPLLVPGRKQATALVHTLDALLMENGNSLKAAQRLGLHRNTVNQRIQRIEQLSGQSIDDPLFRMNASVAMLVWRMSEAHGKE